MARSRERMMPGHDRHVVADHVVEIERLLGLIDQRRDMADVDGLVQVDELAGLPQPVEELAESFLACRLFREIVREGCGRTVTQQPASPPCPRRPQGEDGFLSSRADRLGRKKYYSNFNSHTAYIFYFWILCSSSLLFFDHKCRMNIPAALDGEPRHASTVTNTTIDPRDVPLTYPLACSWRRSARLAKDRPMRWADSSPTHCGSGCKC